MPHKGPLPDDLESHLHLLYSQYHFMRSLKPNPDRVRLINLIESFKKNKDIAYDYHASLGICTYALIKISPTFDLFYPDKNKKRFQFFGSNLGELLQEALYIRYFNPLDEQSAVIYLTKLYHHIVKFPRKVNGEFCTVQENNELQHEIKNMLTVLLERIIKKRPAYSALVNNLSHVYDQYKKMGGIDKERDSYAQFIQILNKNFSDSGQSQSDCKEETTGYSVRYGAMLYLMEHIESEYHLFSPSGGKYLPFLQGSELYKICKTALNIQYKTKEIPLELKRKYYIDLLSYVLKVLSRPAQLKQWQDNSFEDAERFFLALRNHLAERVVDLIKLEQPGSLTLSYVDIVTSTAASYGVTIALGELAGKLQLSGSALSYFNLLKPEAALLITLLTYTLKAIINQKATTALNKVIINTVSRPVTVTFSSFDKMRQFFIDLFITSSKTHAMEILDDPIFIKALASLPKDIYTLNIKDKMKGVIYLKDNVSQEKEVDEEKSEALQAKFG